MTRQPWRANDAPFWTYDPVLFPGGDSLDLLWSLIRDYGGALIHHFRRTP